MCTEKSMIEQKLKKRASDIKRFNSAKKALKELLKENNIILPDTIDLTCIKIRSFVDNTIEFICLREDVSVYSDNNNLIKVFMSKICNDNNLKSFVLKYNYTTQKFIATGRGGISNVIDKNTLSQDALEILLLNFIAGTTYIKQNYSQDKLKLNKIQVIDAEYFNNKPNTKYKGRWSPDKKPTIIMDDFNGVTTFDVIY
jgi:hypothetical protein